MIHCARIDLHMRALFTCTTGEAMPYYM